MVDNNSIGPRIFVEGDQAFKNQMAGIRSEFKELDSEMKLTASQFEKNDKSTEALTAKNQVLGKEIDSQKTRIATLTTQYDKHNSALTEAANKLELAKKAHAADSDEVIRAQKEYDTHTNKVKSFQTEINTATAKLNLMDAELTKNNKSIELQSNSFATFGKTLDGLAPKINTISGGFTSAGQKLTTGVTLPLIAAGAGIAAMVIKTTDAADELQQMADITGLTAERLQELKYVGSKVDVELDTMTNSQKFLTKAMFAAQGGAEAQTDIFNELGISYMDGSGHLRDANVVFGEAIDALGKMENPAERDAMSLKLFGRSAMELNPLIKTGSEEIAKLTDEAHKNGAVMSNESVLAMDKFSDSIAAMKLSLTSAIGKVAAELMPALEDLLPVIQDQLIPAVGGFTKGVVDLIVGFTKLDPTTRNIILGFGAVVIAIGPLLSVIGAFGTVIGGAVAFVGTLIGAIDVMTISAAAATPAVAGLAGALTLLTGPVGIVIGGLALLAGGIALVCANTTKNTDAQTKQLKAYDDQIQSNTALVESIKATGKASNESILATEGEAAAAKTLADKIFDLADKQNKSALELATLDVWIAEFNKLMPSANLLTDEQTGALTRTKDETYKLIDAELQRIQLSAATEALTQITKDQLKIAQEMTQTQINANAEDQKHLKAIDEINKSVMTQTEKTTAINNVNALYGQTLKETKSSMEALTTQQADLSDKYATYEKFISDPAATQEFIKNAGMTVTNTDGSIKSMDQLWAEYTANTPNTTGAAGTATANEFTKSITVGSPFMTAAMQAAHDGVKATVDPLPGELNTIGSSGVVSMGGGIDLSAPIANTAAQGIYGLITGNLNPLGAFGLLTGGELNTGLQGGMQDQHGVELSVGGIVKWVMDAFHLGFNMNSPSLKMHEVGVNILKGLFGGMNALNVGAFADNLVQDLLNSFNQGAISLMSIFTNMGSDGAALLKRMGLSFPTLGSLLFPTDSQDITSYFGNRESPGGIGSTNHAGIDIGAAYGAIVRAVGDGMVTFAGDEGDGYGSKIIMDLGNGLETLFGHLSEIDVSSGDYVRAGQEVGNVGSSGNSTGPHLHYGVYENGVAVDPLSANIGSSGGDLGSWIMQAINATGAGMGNYQHLYDLAMAESSGNPNAINNWDSNAMAGIPSMGLMQTIQSTFDAYSQGGSIWDPVSNAIAAINYMIDRYGSIGNTPLTGYATGTSFASPGVHLVGELGPEFVNFRGGETVYTNKESKQIANSGVTFTQNNYSPKALSQLEIYRNTKSAAGLIRRAVFSV